MPLGVNAIRKINTDYLHLSHLLQNIDKIMYFYISGLLVNGYVCDLEG